MQSQYLIAWGQDLDMLEIQVNVLAGKGYWPTGPIVQITNGQKGTGFIQAMWNEEGG